VKLRAEMAASEKQQRHGGIIGISPRSRRTASLARPSRCLALGVELGAQSWDWGYLGAQSWDWGYFSQRHNGRVVDFPCFVRR